MLGPHSYPFSLEKRGSVWKNAGWFHTSAEKKALLNLLLNLRMNRKQPLTLALSQRAREADF
jgi:hypothetical protein